MSCGRISRLNISRRLWRNFPGESGASVLALAETGSRWGDLTRRVRTALVLLPIALFCVWIGGFVFWLLIAVASTQLAGEWMTLCGFGRSHVFRVWMMAIIVSASFCGQIGVPLVGALLLFTGSAAAALWGEGIDGPLQGGGRARFNLALGFPYIGLAAIAVPWLRTDKDVGLANTLFILSVIWASDIGAYMIGRLVGGQKLAPAISPGKTWSGAAGGLACAALCGFLIANWKPEGSSSWYIIGLALIFGFISQAGDLLESALKRHFGVKDSGSIIPGHGGLLDRLDSLLVVAPVAALLAFTAGRGVVLWR
jgi:phosphatidate cytidylyltransferase